MPKKGRSLPDPLIYPETRRLLVEKNIGGVAFDDSYDWLQTDTEESLEWQWRQDALARDYARAIPGFAELRDRIRENLGPRLEMYARHRVLGGRFFCMTRNDADTGWEVRVAPEIRTDGRVILDTTQLPGHDVNVMAISPSPDGRRLAVAVTGNSEETGRWITLDVATSEVLAPVAEGINLFNCADPGWLPDGSGYLINDRTSDGYHRIRCIAFGNTQGPVERVFSVEEVKPVVPGLTVQVSKLGRWAVTVTEPHQRRALHKLELATGEWTPFTPEDFDGECHGEWRDHETYIALITERSPRGRIVAIPAATSEDRNTWQEIVAESDAVLRAVTVIDGRIVVFELVNVALNIRLFDLDGTPAGTVPIPPNGMSHLALVPRRLEPTEALIFPYASFTQRSTWYHYAFDTSRLTVIDGRTEPLAQLDFHVSQRFAESKDGTRVPYFVVRSATNHGSGPAPALLNVYGGFNVAWLPFPLEHVVPFIEAGGIYLHANLRGGSEYGRDWFEQGCLTNEQNSFDDLYAVAEDAMAQGLAAPDRLALQGHSHGGLVAGVAITQRPDLWRAVCPTSPLLDCMEPVRSGRTDSAATQAYFLQEYGDPEDPEYAERIYSYSPYHNIRPGTAYPAVFQVFGENDAGCAPFHGRKFTAALQAATSSDLPVLLRIWRDTGHGALELGKAAEQAAEWLGFVMHHLGMNSALDE